MADAEAVLIGFDDDPAPEHPAAFSAGEALMLAEQKLAAATAAERASPAMAAAREGRGRYKSCGWIEGAAFIDHPAIKLCCRSSLGGSGNTALFRTATGDPADVPSAAIIAAKRKVRLANQTAQPPCGGCHELQEAEWRASDHLNLAIAGTLHCNLACSYCVTYDFSKDVSRPLAALVRSYLADGTLRAGSNIAIGGGEPTFQRDFAAVAELAFANGVYMNIFTNATAFSEPVAVGLGRGLASVFCSVDAGTPATYRRIKGKDFFDKVWRNLARYVASQPDNVFVKYIMMDANCSTAEIDGFLERALSIGARKIIPSINVHTNPGNGGLPPRYITDAIGYLIVETERRGMVAEWSPDFVDELSPAARQAVGAAIDRIGTGPPLPDAALKEARLEIVFSDSDWFLQRIEMAAAAGDRFRIVLAEPIADGAEPPARLGLIAQIAGRAEGGQHPDDHQKRHAGSLGKIETGALAAWGGRLHRLSDYALGYRLDATGSRLIALDFSPRTG